MIAKRNRLMAGTRWLAAAVGLGALALVATAAPLAAQCNAPGGPAFVSISSPSVVEGDAGTTTLNFTITATGGDVFAITSWATFDVSATDGVDYIGDSGTIDAIGEPPAGDIETYPISITVNGDLDFEPDETLELRITSSSVGPPCFCRVGGDCPSSDENGPGPVGTTGTGTIENDDAMDQPPTAVAGGPYSGNEGAPGIAVNGGGSSDDNGITTYEWDCTSNGSFELSSGSPGATCVYPDDGSFTATLRVTDTIGQQSTATAMVNVANVSPTIQLAGTPVPVDEGSVFSLTLGTITDPGADTVTQWIVKWGDGDTETFLSGGLKTHTYGDGPASPLILVDLVDEDGTHPTAGALSLTVNNVAPVVEAPEVSFEPSNEGQEVTASADFDDPADDDSPFTCTVNYGDGGGAQTGTVAGSTCTGPGYTYGDNGTFSVEICVTDKDDGEGCTSADHLVENVPPTVDPPAVDPTPSDEGEEVVASAGFSDPGTDDSPFTCTVDYGEGAGAQAGTVSGMTCTGDGYTYADNGSFTVEICVTDKDDGEGCASSTHEVENVDPTITDSSNSAADCGATPEGGLVEISVDFEDPGFDSGVAGTFEDFDDSEIDWGDGDVEPATIDETPGSAGTPTTGTASGSHVYATGGIFTITVTVTDDDGGSDTEVLTALVTGAGLNAGQVQIVGTDLKDVVNVKKKGGTLEVKANFIGAGKAAFPLADVLSLRALVCDGNDQVHVNHKLTVEAVLEGGAGRDHMRAGSGATVLLGEGGDDHLFGGSADDLVDGNGGNDRLWGGPGDDTILGSDGDDRLWGEFGSDILDGGPGIDNCNGGPAKKGTDLIINCE